MFEALKGRIIRRSLPMGIIEKIRALVSFAEGHRTQAIMVVYSVIEALKVLNVLTPEQTHSIEAVLTPLAGATFAAKVGRIGEISSSVVQAPPKQ